MLRLIMLLAGVLLLASCHDNHQSAADYCSFSEECEEGQLCFLGKCLSSGNAGYVVYAEITAADLLGQYKQQLYRPFNLINNNYLEIELAEPKQGRLLVKNLSAGTLTLVPQRSIPKRELSYNTYLLADGNSDSQVNLSIVSGRYNVTLRSLDPTLPPYTTTVMWEGGKDLIVEYPLSGWQLYSGQLLWETESVNPVSGAGISGYIADRQKCGTSESGNSGEFFLKCPLGQLTELTVKSTTNNTLIPEYTYRIASDFTGTQLPQISFGSKLPTNFIISGQVHDNLGHPLYGASLTLSEELGNGVYHATAFSQRNGQVEFEVWGQTTAYITASLAGYDERTIELPLAADDNVTFDITLPPLNKLQGHILDNNENPLAEVRIKAQPIKSEQNGAAVVGDYTTNSDNNGFYELSLPSGDYFLDFAPPPNLPQPLHREFVRFYENSTRDIILPKAYLTSGKIIYDKKPVNKALIDLYSPTLATSDKPLLVGQAVTDENGNFVVAIPGW